MEIWWWVLPLLETGLILFLIDLLILIVFSNVMPVKVAAIISIPLVLPIVVAILAEIIWCSCYVFHMIWSPYLV